MIITAIIAFGFNFNLEESAEYLKRPPPELGRYILLSSAMEIRILLCI